MEKRISYPVKNAKSDIAFLIKKFLKLKFPDWYKFVNFEEYEIKSKNVLGFDLCGNPKVYEEAVVKCDFDLRDKKMRLAKLKISANCNSNAIEVINQYFYLSNINHFDQKSWERHKSIIHRFKKNFYNPSKLEIKSNIFNN